MFSDLLLIQKTVCNNLVSTELNFLPVRPCSHPHLFSYLCSSSSTFLSSCLLSQFPPAIQLLAGSYRYSTTKQPASGWQLQVQYNQTTSFLSAATGTVQPTIQLLAGSCRYSTTN